MNNDPLNLSRIILADGWWADWSSWSECSASCGGGTMWRVRECTGKMYGGKECEGVAGDRQPCNTHHCPGEHCSFSNLFCCIMLYRIACFLSQKRKPNCTSLASNLRQNVVKYQISICLYSNSGRNLEGMDDLERV